MAHALLVDSNRSAYPIFQALTRFGHQVSSIGLNETGVLAKLADNHIKLDYSRSDEISILLKDYNFDHLVPGCTDVSYEVCSLVNQGRYPGIDDYETTLRLNHKEQFRRIARRLGVPVPPMPSEHEASKPGSIIVKPSDSYSGHGIQILRDPSLEDIRVALGNARSASRTQSAFLETFIEGQLFSHSAFIRDTKILADFFVQEDCKANSFAVDTSRVSNDVPTSTQRALRKNIERIANTLNLVDGLLHTQFILQNDSFWLIDVTRRCPGDLYSLLVELSTGYPYAANYAAPFIGRSLEPFHEQGGAGNLIVRHTMTAPQGMPLWALRFNRPVNIRLWVPLAMAGDRLDPVSNPRAAIVFFDSRTPEEQQAIYNDLITGSLYSFE
jgi:glutathione synthase/RimK-type ligase-like ATP-grasp enzyme